MRSVDLRFGFALLLLDACGAPSSPPAVTAGVVDTSPPPTASVNAAAADAAPPLPPDVEDVTAVDPPAASCTLEGVAWHGDVGLRAAPNGPRFARLRKAHHAEALLVDPRIAFFRAGTGSARVGGFVALDEVRASLRRATVIAGFFVPSGEARLRVTGLSGAQLSLGAQTPDGVELASGTTLDAQVACGDARLGKSSFDVDDALAGAKPIREALFARKGKVALSTDPSGPAVARITVGDPDDMPTVEVLEERAGRTRIRFEPDGGLVFGWVRSSDLRRVKPSDPRMAILAALSGGPGISIFGRDPSEGTLDRGAPGGERVACPNAPRLLVQLNGRRYRVGELAALAPFVVDQRGLRVAALHVPGSLDSGGDVSWMVPSRDLVGCAASAAEEPADPADAIDPSSIGIIAAKGPLDPDALTSGTGTGQGIGLGAGRAPASKGPKAPPVREGAIAVRGRLPPEVIQRIVRQNFGRFRLCYENGLRTQPALQGRVAVKFDIEADGSVAQLADGGSDLPDPAVVSCVVRGFGNLSFPQPESGTVSVVYPVLFSPGN